MTTKRRDIQIGIASSLIIALSLLFVVRSCAFTHKSIDADNTIETIRPPGQTSISAHDIIESDRLYERIYELTLANANMNILNEIQRKELAHQVSSMAKTQAGDNIEDYIQLMESWGGDLKLSNPEVARLKKGWLPREHALSIARYDIDRLEVDIFQDRSGRARPPLPVGLSATRYMSSFQFNSSINDLIDSHAPLAAIRIPEETNRGDALEREYLLFWSESDNVWVPWLMWLMSDRSTPAPVTLF